MLIGLVIGTVLGARQLWRALGHKSASIGTLGVTTSVDQVHTGLTTPDIVTFLSNMAGLKKEGITHAAFEASSHGLAQYRTEGLPVMAGAFTFIEAREEMFGGADPAPLHQPEPAVLATAPAPSLKRR